MLTFRDFSAAFRKLEIDHSQPIIAHASLSAFGEVHGGAETLLGALMMGFNTLISYPPSTKLISPVSSTNFFNRSSASMLLTSR